MPEAIRTARKRLPISRDKHCRIAPLCDNAREDVCRPCWSATCASRRSTSDTLHEDRASGARDDRPGLKACLADLRRGDVLVVWKLDRLGRSLSHLIQIVEQLKTRDTGPTKC
jgi:DNA invertase Pin-like site-specific DNA recombinase